MGERPAETPGTTRRPRSRALPLVIVAVATVVGLLSVFALWTKRQALETETWAATSSELLEDEAIRDAVADFIVAAVFDNVDVQSEVASLLPRDLEPLAGPASGGLRQLTDRVAREALARPRVQALWEDANATAHAKLIDLIDDEGEFASIEGGAVTLDLSGIVAEVVESVGLPEKLTARLPAAAASIEVLRADELETAQTAVRALRAAAWVLSGLTVALFALAIFLARGRRRETLRAVGFAFVFVGIVVLLVREVAGSALTGALTGTAAAGPPVDATWQIATSLQVETAQSLIAYGVAIVLAAWLAGPTGLATALRRAIAPYLRRPSVAYGAWATGLALLFWWNPVVATGRLAPSLLLAVLTAVGVEALRRQVIREFPDHVTARSPEGVARVLRERMSDARAARSSSGAGPGGGSDATLDSLERLARLRESGLLTDEEVAAEKQRLLGGQSSSA